ncbi:hypothetical protein DFH11DRAFT_1728982 [Phellopilus nigrolimitatus]|nr:hypothetical protein DFH11DRAFT_1728982 [Phellopilus nigrolimitatus]
MYAQQAKGTLMPGQMIAVNKYNVQVERFLSQGGFAHVYLVRTAEPVFNTTHHVLKRIAVANEAMLNDVKKEVDIMRILRGHPNIVYLIDAAWHKMPNGMFEVFILMEFCSGGGIIDMMNRRLRERLTEAEILQIFVDVSEGTAAMHNLRPPLLHRDLKVENILQASAMSYKLCDFGSAMPVAPRPPSSTQEIRALEADLNKHTTLQYRAPEMVDVYLRRPVDEKSDVWALGVLLYKLCYYTTPFEEHGVLAILNVQYKFPPYPVYSQQLNALIASMLREHGAHRPTVFEILDTVHQMRGTKSRFNYNPLPKQSLSPRKLPSPIPSRNEALSSARTPDTAAPVHANGIQAREKVLEAIAPMRRGRPSSPTKARNATDDAFGLIDAVEGARWSAVNPARAHKSGLATVSAAKSPIQASRGLGDAWEVPGAKSDRKQATGTSNGFGDSFDTAITQTAPRPVTTRSGSSLRPPGDAFDSLSMFPSPRSQALTLGEAQKAALSAPRQPPSPQPSPYKFSTSSSPSFTSPSPVPTGNMSSMQRRDASPLLKSKPSEGLSAEQRFPSLEELDAVVGTLSSGSSHVPQGRSPVPQLPPRPCPGTRPDSGRAVQTSMYPASVTGALRPPSGTANSLSAGPRGDGVRSQQVTGSAMRDARKGPSPSSAQIQTQTNVFGGPSSPNKPKLEQTASRLRSDSKSREKLNHPSRPILTRKHRSSVSIKHPQRSGSASPQKAVAALPADLPKDWLSGADAGGTFDNNVVVRASPEKRTSIIHSPVPVNAGQQAVRATSPTKRKPVPIHRPTPIEVKRKPPPEEKDEKTVSGLTENWSPLSPELKSSSSEEADEGPEDAVASVRSAKVTAGQRIGHNGRHGSVHDLVDLWGGSGTPQFQKPPMTKPDKRNSMLSAPSSVNSTPSGHTKEPRPAMAPSLSSVASNSSSADKPPQTRSGVSRKPSLDTRRPSTNYLRQPSSPTKAQRPSTPSKTRPQSMLILPMQKSLSENVSSPSSPQSALSPPKTKVAHRRSSISDIVERYEAIGVHGKSGTHLGSGQAPAPSAKPTRLRMVSPTSLSSPTTASARFPRISPVNSPVRTSLDLPARSPTRETPQRATSPSLRPGTPVRQNASPLLPKDKELAPAASTTLSQRTERSERFERKPLNLPSTSSPFSKEQVPVPGKVEQTEEPSSPSPERPYQGVSKLIDQWQKKTEDVDGGAKGGGSGFKGAGSRFRREGIAAGGSKAS